MSDEQNQLLRQILAELKAANEASAQFRAVAQRESTEQRTRWLSEAEEQRQFRAQSARLQRGVLAILFIGVASAIAIAVWSINRPTAPARPAAPQLVPIEQ